jgi:hypothetical protein
MLYKLIKHTNSPAFFALIDKARREGWQEEGDFERNTFTPPGHTQPVTEYIQVMVKREESDFMNELRKL